MAVLGNKFATYCNRLYGLETTSQLSPSIRPGTDLPPTCESCTQSLSRGLGKCYMNKTYTSLRRLLKNTLLHIRLGKYTEILRMEGSLVFKR